MSQKIQKLNQKLNKKKNEIGLISGTAKVDEYDDAEYNISAHIDPHNWSIEVNLKTGFNPVQDNWQKIYAEAKEINDGLETLVLHVGGLHEPGHWELPIGSEKGIPYDTYNHDKIVEATKKGLQEKGKNPELIVGNNQTLAGYVANVFEDVFDNTRCKEYNKDFSGQVLFWDNEWMRVKEQGQKNFNGLYEAFVKLNMCLWGDLIDAVFLSRHYSNEEKVNSAVQNIIRELNLQSPTRNTDYLFEKQKWPEMAEKFAKNLADLLDEIPQERLSAYDMSGQGEGSGENSEQTQSSGNAVEQKSNTREGKENIAYGRYASGDKQSPNFTSFEQLDSLYRRLARDIPVKVEAITKQHSMEIAPLNYRAFDEEKDDTSRLKLSKLFVDENGLKFGHPNEPLTIDYRSKIQRKAFPNFKMLVVDNSGSMKQGLEGGVGSQIFIPWGNNSKYHWALVGYYGIENFLQKQGISPYIEHGVSLFSSATRYERGSYAELERIRKLLLSPDWGSTNLDASVLKQALQGEEGAFLVTLSDGEIFNWSDEKDEVLDLYRKNYVAHIQLGNSETDYVKDLQNANIPVKFVNRGEDLAKLMVNITKNTYNKFVRT